MCKILLRTIIFCAFGSIAYAAENVTQDGNTISEADFMAEYNQNPWSHEHLERLASENPDFRVQIAISIYKGWMYLPPDFRGASYLITENRSDISLSGYELYVLLRFGEGGDLSQIKEIVEAHLNKDLGEVPAELLKGLLLCRQQNNLIKLSDVVNLYKIAAKKGSVAAYYELAKMFYFGRGIKQDMQQAAVHMKIAADMGHVLAQYNYGVMLICGQGTRKNLELGWLFIEKAANTSHREAQFDWGYHLYLQKKYHAAAYYYEQAAKYQHFEAQYALAYLYLYGSGIEKDETKAFFLCKSAATNGHSMAQYYLGYLLEAYGAEEYRILAIEWYEKAASQKVALAQKALKRLRKPS